VTRPRRLRPARRGVARGKKAVRRTASSSFELRAGLVSLREIRRVIESQARSLGIGRARIYGTILAVEEACSNVIRHAYADGARPGGRQRRLKPLAVSVETSAGRVEILIRDVGRAFDFERYPASAIADLALKKRLRGGYGIHLIKSLVDRYEYIRSENGENHLRLVKYLD